MSGGAERREAEPQARNQQDESRAQDGDQGPGSQPREPAGRRAERAVQPAIDLLGPHPCHRGQSEDGAYPRFVDTGVFTLRALA
ncbi:hypothetical protein GCM10009591_37630 [Brachybacterium tyrofermentans]